MYTFHYAPFRISTHSDFPGYNELFFDRLQTLQTKRLDAVYVSDYYTAMFCDNLPGEDLSLFLMFAETLQFAVNFREMQCNLNETMGHCLSRCTNGDFIINRLYVTQYSKYMVSRAAMEQLAIATPKGRLLTVWEILLKPFQQSAWTMMLVLLATCQLVQLLAPTLFVNNILSLALFGFEKRELHLTKFAEKLTASALIILFFQLKCAYEAKLVSYITDTPRVPDALSIEDLRTRNITVHYGKLNLDHVEQLSGMIAPYHGDRLVFDGVTLLDNREILMMEKLFSDNIDSYAMPYSILSDNVYEILPFYMFGLKSLLLKRFHTYQQRLFESGMQLHWRQQHLNCFLLHIVRMHHISGANTGVKAAIRYDHLKPLVLFFLAQWIIATMIFVVELIVGRYSAYKRSRAAVEEMKQKQSR
uniref:Ionotropic glutamate receptor C-terminal domain-containing protein n=1 Tax=Anopheles maculatus TaxID=74869 RepID=A0A182SDS6_9DIPT